MGKGLEKSFGESVDRRRGIHDEFATYAPSQAELTPHYIAQTDRLGQVLDEHMYGPSQAAQAAYDPYGAGAQGEIFDQYKDIYSQQGLGTADRARLQQGINQTNQQTRARQEAMLQAMAGRGMSGSGLEFQARLSNEAAGANRMADQNAQMQMYAGDRMMQALDGAGRASSNRYDMLYQSGTAEDVINQANTDRRRTVYDDNLKHQRDMDAGRVDTANKQADAGVQGAKDSFNAQSIVSSSANNVEDAELDRIAYKNAGIDKVRANERYVAEQIKDGLSSLDDD